MATDLRSELANIKDFEQLVVFLRDQMGWPIGSEDSFEELTFEYTPEELGIDEKNAAKIQEIKRLRPLTSSQPWGIFFVKFEPKALPVVALRRILSQVTLKKRSSANPSERKSWSEDDLLFISNYGETVERKISLAHFSKPHSNRDLPTLKVLGWDNLDTPLHLDSVVRELTQNLAWPEKEEDIDKWRLSWTGAFKLLHRETITTAKELSVHLAELARTIRDRINTALAIETEHGPLTNLYKAFQKSLIHDLSPQGFADMYAQTITYGLLSARIENPKKKTVEDFGNSLRTNPFLRELMETFLKIGGRGGKDGGPGIDFDELGVSEVVELLDNSNMEAVLRDFGDRNPQEDPVIHFYEHFLAAYDKKQKVSRGVFYTPRPVVSFIVRSVDEMLCKEFGLEDGLADTTTWGEMAKKHEDFNIPEGVSPDQDFIQILDPATGTGTFLVEAIDLIHKRLIKKWKADNLTEQHINDLWNDYVPKHLLTRLHGYELLMAPYAIAHLKIGIKLFETGYAFGSNERARIYLTNALEPAQDFSENLEFAIPALAHEAREVNEIKASQKFSVVIGNPPYSNFGQLNKSSFILSLMQDYKRGLKEKKININDDFIKFIRFAQFLISQTGFGILGYITNSSYLDGLTHRVMRSKIFSNFNLITILNLHGSTQRGEINPSGGLDQNVFDIMQGVAIGFFALTSGSSKALYADLWGKRESKYCDLGGLNLGNTNWENLSPQRENYFFLPKNFSFYPEYERGISLLDVFLEHQNGIKTDRDDLFFAENEVVLANRIKKFYTEEAFTNPFRDHYKIENSSSYPLLDRRNATSFNSQAIKPCLYRPFDVRMLYYQLGLTSRPAHRVMRHMNGIRNLALLTCRQQAEPGFHHIFVTRLISECCAVSLKTREITTVFPLFLVEDFHNQQQTLSLNYQSNFSQNFLKILSSSLDITKTDMCGFPIGVSPEKLFKYVYSILHSPTYRSRYEELLKIDFPRLFLPRTLEFFCDLACLGDELVALHLMESSKINTPITTYLGPNNPEVERVGWSDDTVWLNAAATKKGQFALPGKIGFQGVSEDVWSFHIGGYQVCAKWLKDRKGRKLSGEDIIHYQKIVVAISETLRIMKEIDAVIDKHGGWPGAFEGK